MKKVLIILLCFILHGFSKDLINFPPLLIKNEGQLRTTTGTQAHEVLYYMQTPSLDFFITRKGISYVFKQFENVHPREFNGTEDVIPIVHWHRVDIDFVGAHITDENAYVETNAFPTISFYNEFVPEGLEHRPTYKKIVFKNIYPNIDLEWIVDNEMLKYNFLLHPGANIENIQLDIMGAKELIIDSTTILIVSEFGILKEGPLMAFTSRDNKKIQVQYNQISPNRVGFIVLNSSNYIKEEMIIDPPLIWSTYYGGSGIDDGYKIVASPNAIYAVFQTRSTDFPVFNPGPPSYYLGTYIANLDGSIAKFSLNGTLQWATFYGGANDDAFISASYGNGVLAVVGYTTSTNIPTFNPGIGNYFQANNAGGRDAFIVVFGPNEVRVWATYMGGTSDDEYNDVFIETSTNLLWVGGSTLSNNIPVVNFPPYYYQGTSPDAADWDIFIQRFNSFLTLTYSTYFGGDETDRYAYFDVAPNGSKMFHFQTTSNNLPVIPYNANSYQQNVTLCGAVDSYAILFNNSMQIAWGSYICGDQNDFAYDVIFADSLWYLTGATYSLTTFPTANVYSFPFFRSYAGNADAYLTVINPTGRMIYSTGIGTNSIDAGLSLSYDPTNRYLYVLGYTQGSGLVPSVNPNDGSYYKGSPNLYEAFVTQFDSTMRPVWSTFFGGNSTDRFRSSTISNGVLYITGFTQSSSLFPLKDLNPGTSYFDNTLGGSQDAILVAFKPCPKNFNTITAPAGVCNNSIGTIYATGGTTYLWNNGSTSDTIHFLMQHDTTYRVTATNSWGCIERDTVTILNYPLPNIVISPSTSLQVCLNQVANLTASGGTSYIWSNGSNSSSTSVLVTSDSSLYVIVTNSYNCKDTSYVNIQALPLPNVTISGKDSICPNISYSYIAQGASTYSWDNGTSHDTAWYSFTTNGNYTIQVIGTSNAGCKDTAYFSIYVVTPPVASITAPSILCYVDTAQICGNGGVYYFWNVPNTNIDSTFSCFTFHADTGQQIIQLTVKDAYGCISMPVQHTITRSVRPSVFNGSQVYKCKEHSVSLSYPHAGTYLWSTGQSNQTIYVSQVGLYYVTYTNSLGCVYKDSVYVLNFATPPLSLQGNPSGLCNNTLPIILHANPSGGTWNGPGITNPSTGSFDPSSLTPGVYILRYVYVDSNQCTSKDSITLEIYSIPSFTTQVTEESCKGAHDGKIIISAFGGTAPYVYYVDNSQHQSEIKNLAPGSYAIYVVDQHGCSSSSQTVNIPEGLYLCGEIDVFVPTIFSPNNDGINDVFYVQSAFIKSMYLAIFDRYGTKIFETTSQNEGWDGTYHGTPVVEGVYFYYLQVTFIDDSQLKKAGDIRVVR
ncbi:MAG: gliding motility-associated C-terminal domain-containing protein [Bacteroidales bacterium]|nr:gliding motility-associated C-terminal domain-containing protein [Bacteroidales bacterium]